MGRHAAPPPEDAGQTRGAPTDPAPTARTWWEHAVLAVVAALAVAGVMAWTGGASWAAALGGLATAGVVLAAGWLAGRLPHDGAGPG